MLMITTSEVLQEILIALREELQETMGSQLEAIYLYGSQARGEARPDSDIDILIVVRGEHDYLELLERVAPVVCGLSLEHDVVISPAFISKERYDQEQIPFILNVRREAVAL